MRIRKIEFQNIFSFGNKKIIIDYDNLGDGSLNMILGKNGCGKSSFIKLHKLALYFESDGVTADGIANDINGNGFLAIDVDSRGSSWRVESEYNRTKLSSLRVYKNGEEQDWGKIPDTKKMIKSEVIDIPYHIFSNIISLSVNDFKSFLSMTPKDTRNIRDRIFGFYVLNDMMESIKSSAKIYNEKHKTLQSHLQTLEGLRDDLSQKIEDIHSSDNREKRSELEGLIREKKCLRDNFSSDISGLQEKHRRHVSYMNRRHDEKLKESISGLQKEVSEITMDMEKRSNEHSSISESISDISQKLSLHSKHREYMRKLSVMKEVDSLRKEMSALESSRTSMSEEMNGLKSIIDDFSKKSSLMDLLSKRDSVEEDIKKCQKEINNLESDINVIDDTCRDISRNISRLSDSRIDLSSRMSMLDRWKHTHECGKCDQCGSDFQSSDSSKISEFQDEIDKILENIGNIDEEISSLTSLKDSHNENLRSVGGRLLVEKQKMNTLSSELSTVNDAINNCGYSEDDIRNAEMDENIPQKYEELKLEHVSVSETISGMSSKIGYMISTIENIQDVDGDMPEESEDELTSKKSSLEQNKETILDMLRKYKESISEINYRVKEYELQFTGDTSEVSESDFLTEEELQAVTSSISEKQTLLNNVSSEISDLESEVSKMKIFEASQIENLEKMMSEYETKMEDARAEIKKCYNGIRFYALTEHVISDDGVKSYIIKNVVPHINKSVNDILSNLEIPLTVKFDDEFKPSIYRFGKPVSINSISTGQTKMIDSAIIFTITKFLISRCGGINIVFYDEIFSSLHQSAISMMMEIIHRELVDDMKLHVFLVNHSFVSSSFFNNIFELSMVDHFSNLKIMGVDEYNRQRQQ